MLGKTKKNLALKITLGLVLALPVGTALAADTATIVDYCEAKCGIYIPRRGR